MLLALTDLWTWQLVLVVLLGLVAGVLGGMLGVGGSVLMIPGLAAIFGPDQHVYQAAAMIANIAVSAPAARRHARAGAMRPAVLRWMMPAAIVCVVVGVSISNLPIFRGDDGKILLQRVFGAFLLYVIYTNVRKLLRDRALAAAVETDPAYVSPAASTFVGGVMGTIAGMMGVGGGAIAVPLQQVLLRLPLRSCIANSSLIICFSATVGAIYKNATLAASTQGAASWTDSLTLGLILGPSCFLGGRVGASLTHRLPLRQVRVAFICLMVAASAKMLGLLG